MNEAQYKGEVQRLWISSLTTEAIKEGFNNLKPAANYDNLYYAGFSRAIGDWLLV
jgi:DNA topoisomerase-3